MCVHNVRPDRTQDVVTGESDLSSCDSLLSSPDILPVEDSDSCDTFSFADSFLLFDGFTDNYCCELNETGCRFVIVVT